MTGIIDKHYLFAPLSEADRQRLTQRKNRRYYHAGSMIFTRNQATTDFFFVISGTVRLYVTTPTPPTPSPPKTPSCWLSTIANSAKSSRKTTNCASPSWGRWPNTYNP